jgi:uncharacterized lipoprotein YmbA
MKQNVTFRILGLGNIIITLLLTACGTSPPARFYTLTPLPIQIQTEKVVINEKSKFIAIGPVEIPEYLDRIEIVTRAEPNQLVISEFDLWGGSIKTDISRVLVENIGSFLAGDGIAVIAWKTNVTESHRVPVIFSRFDAIAGGNLILKAQWAVLDKEGKTFLSFKEINVTKPVKGSSYNSIVAAMSDSLGDLSKAIAESITSIRDSIIY